MKAKLQKMGTKALHVADDALHGHLHLPRSSSSQRLSLNGGKKVNNADLGIVLGREPEGQGKSSENLMAYHKKNEAVGIKAKLAKCCKWICQKIAASAYFSGLTTILTIYALFGDDMRLIFTDKPADYIFDVVCIVTMAVFGVEILVCSVGKAGYLLGFFFYLDVLSTVTLILDVTVIAEILFGDSISSGKDAQESSGGGTSASDSAGAARAARMSRAGTKAGRVVRLIRLLRLIRLIKVFRKKKGDNQHDGPSYESMGPGDDWEEEEEESPANVNESAVSKKLSEMTTRRVIMLVLSILLILPFFQPDMWKDALSTSAQYGIDNLYRRFREDMVKFNPTAGPKQRKKYLDSFDRENYQNDFLLYIYFHNWFCEYDDSDKSPAPDTSFGKLFWIGGSPIDQPEADFFLPGSNATSKEIDWNSHWSGPKWSMYLCKIPKAAQAALRTSWFDTQKCLDGRIRGVSLIESKHGTVTCPVHLRFQERIIISPRVMSKEESRKFVMMFVFDRRAGSRMEAALNSGQTIFICGLLGVGAMVFAADANKLVLAPIERMITKLDKIRENPLAAMTIGEEESHKEQLEAYKKRQEEEEAENRKESFCTKLQKMCSCSKKKETDPEPMETVVLEKTIIKIGSLLALGFGEAGAEVIGENMRGESSKSTMIPGKKVDAIYGFCDIRNFSDATEVLDVDVMIFVNRIAGVVHSCVNEFFGSPNQNNGDAFLLVWRLSGLEDHQKTRMYDCSVVSFMRIIAAISKSSILAEYRSHEQIVKRLPNFRVRMGFGLHTGWAIEGAIGSEFKIDASYLSPNVNIASRLQDFTKVYGNSIMLSEALVNVCTDPISSLCRQIDRVAFSHTCSPFHLFTLDLDDLILELEPHQTVSQCKSAQFRATMERKKNKALRWADEFSMMNFLRKDQDFQQMRRKFTRDFFTKFKKAVTSYEAGNWSEAVDQLEEVRSHTTPPDGPAGALLSYMDQYQNEVPDGWPGYRIYVGTDYA